MDDMATIGEIAVKEAKENEKRRILALLKEAEGKEEVIKILEHELKQ